VPEAGAVVLEDSGAEVWDEQATTRLSAIAAKKTLKNFKNRIGPLQGRGCRWFAA
jgi:hypothetical protein